MPYFPASHISLPLYFSSSGWNPPLTVTLIAAGIGCKHKHKPKGDSRLFKERFSSPESLAVQWASCEWDVSGVPACTRTVPPRKHGNEYKNLIKTQLETGCWGSERELPSGHLLPSSKIKREVTLSGEEPCIHVEDVQASRGICEYTCFCRNLLSTSLLSYTNLLQLMLLHYLLGQSPKLGGSQSPLPLHNPASPAALRSCTPLPPVTPSPCHHLSFTTRVQQGCSGCCPLPVDSLCWCWNSYALAILSASLFLQNALGLESFLGYLMHRSCLAHASS